MRVCVCLALFLSLFLLIAPAHAVQANNNFALQLVQNNTCRAGESVELSLVLPETAIAGGFVTLEYDPLLFRELSI